MRTKGFEGVTAQDVKRMPMREVHLRIFEQLGFWKGTMFICTSLFPSVVLALVIIGLFELWIFIERVIE